MQPQQVMNSSPSSIYSHLLKTYSERASVLQKQLGWLSTFRVLLFIGFLFFGWRSFQTASAFHIITSIVSLAGFLLSIRFYDTMQRDLAFFKALTTLNSDEIDFLAGKPSVYADGQEYTDPHHPYSYDLDLFGPGGLFTYLNRCSTSFGKEKLAKALLHPDTANIVARQEAIAELKEMIEFRQHLQAHGSLLDTKEKEMQQLRAWLKAGNTGGQRFWYLLLIIPAISLSSLAWYLFTENERALNTFYFLFVLNIFVAFSFSRRILAHLSVSTSVTKVLQQFAGQFNQIEKQSFQSGLLKQLQQDLKAGDVTASQSISRLASLFNYLESVVNLVVSMLLNGLFLFHVFILYRLERWKQRDGGKILPWLERLGEMEALNSLANLSYNNPAFCRPEASTQETLEAVNMGHVLIRPGKRINNSISFSDRSFIVLTGSNMSGKSTFLRTLGTNLILARAGSVVCAEQFRFFPYAVHVSMRITDSLQDSESFFYAELKRLHAIIAELETGSKTFVILDEILRGTNSNDKHSGTVGLIRKMVRSGACGIIATHDLTVSKLAEEYPTQISNKCFESEIIHDELVFDYRLKDGVCTRLSASFLMKKMGIIDND